MQGDAAGLAAKVSALAGVSEAPETPAAGGFGLSGDTSN